MGAVMAALTVVCAAGSYTYVKHDGLNVVEAAGRPVSIDSCVISGGSVVVNVSASSLPGSDDGKYYLYADEVYQDGTTGKVVATTQRAGSASFTFDLGYNTSESVLSKKFLVAVKSGGSMVQVSDEHYITNPEAVTPYLIGIRWADALAGSADAAVALQAFPGGIEKAVAGQN